MNRASVYLVDRASALLQTIRFFRGASKGMNQNDKRLVFLSQLHFWDFEIDSLLYVFQTFAERQQDWDNSGPTPIESKILKQNLIVKRSYMRDFAFNQTNRYGHWNPYRFDRRQKVVAPLELLNETIEEWNKLLDECQYLLISEKEVKSAELAGCKVTKNLNHLKKTISNSVVAAFDSKET